MLTAPFGKEGQEGLFAEQSRGGHIAQRNQLPLNLMPFLLGNEDTILSHITQVSGTPLSFHAQGLYPQKYASGLGLIPFCKIQGERYIIYWPQADSDKVQKMQQQQAKVEEKERQLDSITIDKVSLGEQQPESDHFIEINNSDTGYMEDRHYRDARGWLSYQLRNKTKNSQYLYISYFDANKRRTLSVDVNGKNVKSVQLEGKSGNALQFMLLPIEQEQTAKEILTIKSKSENDYFTARIVEVRLLENEYKIP